MRIIIYESTDRIRQGVSYWIGLHGPDEDGEFHWLDEGATVSDLTCYTL